MNYAEVNTLNDVDAAWLAGIIDGEGSVTLTTERKRQKFKQPQLCVTSTSRNIIDTIERITGVGHVRIKLRREEHHKDAWSWQVKNGRQVLDVLTQILPFMREENKVARARLLTDNWLRVTMRNGRYSESQMEEKLAFESAFFAG